MYHHIVYIQLHNGVWVCPNVVEKLVARVGGGVCDLSLLGYNGAYGNVNDDIDNTNVVQYDIYTIIYCATSGIIESRRGGQYRW